LNRRLTFAYPGDLSLKTGGYGYDRRIIDELTTLGWTITPLSLGDGFPAPCPRTKQHAERLLSSVPDGELLLIDGLAFGVLDDWARQEGRRLTIVALVHHPLALETGLEARRQDHLHARETRALSSARHVIVTSLRTARELSASYGVEPDRITVAVPGTDPAAVSLCAGEPPHIVSIGTLTPRKGHDVLVRALKQVEDLPWNATIVGSHGLDPATAGAVKQRIEALCLAERIRLVDACDDTRPLLAQADLFALASRYEGYGMAFAEALSQGVPIVGCRAGAVADLVPEAAGLLVAPDDVDAFAAALRSLIEDKALRRRMADAARRSGASLPAWAVTADSISRRLRDVS